MSWPLPFSTAPMANVQTKLTLRDPHSPTVPSRGKMDNPSSESPAGRSHWLGWFVVLAVATGLFAWRMGHEPLWLDETYSFAMTQHGFADIVRLTTGDVHPPLYYLILKLLTVLLGDSPTALRLPSLLAAVGLLALATGPVRRLFGHRTALVYALLVITSPGVLCFAQEARMYTLSALLVTGAVLYGQLSLIEPRKTNLVWFGIFTWSAAMTHYFGLLAAGMNCLVLVGVASVKHRDRLRPLLVTSLAAGGLYLPWFGAFARQVTTVTSGFWIPSTSWELLVFGLVAPFTYKFEDVPYPWQAPVALGIIVVLVTVTLLVKVWRGPPRVVNAQLHALAVYLLTLGFALGFSRWIQPVFMPRYMMCCAGLLLLGAAAGICRLPRLSYVVTSATLLVSLGLPAWLRTQVATFNGPFAALAERVRDAGEPAPVLFHNDVQALYPSWHAASTARHVMVTQKGAKFDVSGGGVYETSRLSSTDALAPILDSTRRVWLVDAEPAGFHVDPAQILERRGWLPQGPVLELSQPRSWVKVKLTRFEKQDPL